MFEKEAEEYYEETTIGTFQECAEDFQDAVETAFIDGAEYGYNQAKKEMEEIGLALQSDMDKTIAQNLALKKANEWHYPSKGELPPEDKKYLVCMNDGTIDILRICIDGNGDYYFAGIGWDFADLVAWKYLSEPPKEV